MDYLNKIVEIENLTKLITGDRILDNTFDLIFEKCQELRKILSSHYVDW